MKVSYLCLMAKILCLETATTNCSVAIGVDGELKSLIEENSPNYSHSEQLHVFIEATVKEAGLQSGDLDAVAVSKGPGSYTGLRIGVSAAKGLCFSLDIPLISIPTLESLAHQIEAKPGELIIPVLDARRMEVYSAVFDHYYNEVRETRAEIVDENSFGDYAANTRLHLVGSGAEKCKEVIALEKTEFYSDKFPSAKEMAKLAFKKYKQSDFEDVAYFEPYYLKDFILQSKKKA